MIYMYVCVCVNDIVCEGLCDKNIIIIMCVVTHMTITYVN